MEVGKFMRISLHIQTQGLEVSLIHLGLP